MFESSVILQGTKTKARACPALCAFESSVILQGTKTGGCSGGAGEKFESSVILQGTKTDGSSPVPGTSFESSVILQGTKTARRAHRRRHRLRVVQSYRVLKHEEMGIEPEFSLRVV